MDIKSISSYVRDAVASWSSWGKRAANVLLGLDEPADKTLENRLIKHEGSKKSVYKDSLGFFTIGVGRCVDERKELGLFDDEIIYLLRNDIKRAKDQLDVYLWFQGLDDVRQDACVEIVFNVGLQSFLGFKNTIQYLTVKNYDEAAKKLFLSKWTSQVGTARAQDVAYRIRYGKYP